MNEDTSRKFFDVAKPGRSAPSPTSRPVISNAPQPDPMMHEKPAYNLQLQAAAKPAPTELPIEMPAPAPRAAHEPDPLPPEPSPQGVIDPVKDFKPRKPTKSRSRVVLMLLFVLVVVAAAALGIYPLIRSRF